MEDLRRGGESGVDTGADYDLSGKTKKRLVMKDREEVNEREEVKQMSQGSWKRRGAG